LLAPFILYNEIGKGTNLSY